MTSDHSGYPLPAYAMTIWLAGDQIHITLPSGPGGKIHTIRIPLAKCSIETSEWGEPLARQRGWLVLLELLKQRQQERTAPIRMGDRAAPVQYDIDQMLKAVSGASADTRKFNSRGVEQIDYDALFGDK
jgi:hypothetical protein